LPGDGYTFGAASAAGCFGGATASILSDLVTYIFDSDDVPVDPPSNFHIPPDPEPIDDGTTGKQTSQDGDDGGDNTGDNNAGSGGDGGDAGDGGDGGDGGDEGDSGLGGCFVAGTPVHTTDKRLLSIEKIGLDTQLVNCAEDGAGNGSGIVTRLFNTISTEIVTLCFENGETVRCTPRHRFFTNRGWLSAESLTSGTTVRGLNGVMWPVRSVSKSPESTPVFNMRVDQEHTYFVGETGFLVHNMKDLGSGGDDGADDAPLRAREKSKAETKTASSGSTTRAADKKR